MKALGIQKALPNAPAASPSPVVSWAPSTSRATAACPRSVAAMSRARSTETIAIPTAPNTCCPMLNKVVAFPTSRRSTSWSAAVDTGIMVPPIPMPWSMSTAPKNHRLVPAVTVVSSSSEAAMAATPKGTTRPAGRRSTIRAAIGMVMSAPSPVGAMKNPVTMAPRPRTCWR